MKKQIILHIIQTTIEIEVLFLLIFLFASAITNDYSRFWRSFLLWQPPAVCIIVFSTLSFHTGYMDEIEREEWRENMQKFWNEFKKRNGQAMRYIRTKNGIYDTTKGLYTPSIKMFAIGTKTIYYDDIIKQANTIEELCDGFVAVKENASGNNTIFFIEFEDWEEWISGYDIYGGIWTDKGFIYVAKMNENGDLV